MTASFPPPSSSSPAPPSSSSPSSTEHHSVADDDEPPLVIIGSGPCGLGAAYRLQELGIDNFVVLEAGAVAGGLSITATDEQGFLWDMGKCAVVGLPAHGATAGCERQGALLACHSLSLFCATLLFGSP